MLYIVCTIRDDIPAIMICDMLHWQIKGECENIRLKCTVPMLLNSSCAIALWEISWITKEKAMKKTWNLPRGNLPYKRFPGYHVSRNLRRH